MEWISVEDRLPPENEMVLLFCPGTRFTRGQFHIGQWDSSKQWWMSEDGQAESTKNWFSHWIPLPKPPKRERKYTWESSGVHDDSGYVIYDLDGKRIEPQDLVNALNTIRCLMDLHYCVDWA